LTVLGLSPLEVKPMVGLDTHLRPKEISFATSLIKSN